MRSGTAPPVPRSARRAHPDVAARSADLLIFRIRREVWSGALDSRLGLPVNTVLAGSYRIVRQIGAGGFGITYAAEDINLGTTIAIKEYYPEAFGDRDAAMSVRPKSERHEPTFEWGRSSFVQEARTLARFQHASVVRVTRVFEANSTAYMVMDFEAGENFETWLKGLGRLPTQEELDRIVAPLLDALATMHAEQFLHRDIAPDNIIIRADGSPVLLDFGAARRAVAERSRALTGIVKAGYSPARAIRFRQPVAGTVVRSLCPRRHALSCGHRHSSGGGHAPGRRRQDDRRGKGDEWELPARLPGRNRGLPASEACGSPTIGGAAAPNATRGGITSGAAGAVARDNCFERRSLACRDRHSRDSAGRSLRDARVPTQPEQT